MSVGYHEVKDIQTLCDIIKMDLMDINNNNNNIDFDLEFGE